MNPNKKDIETQDSEGNPVLEPDAVDYFSRGTIQVEHFTGRQLHGEDDNVSSPPEFTRKQFKVAGSS